MKKLLIIPIFIIMAGCTNNTDSYNYQKNRLATAQLLANITSENTKETSKEADKKETFCNGFEDGYFAVCQGSRYVPSCNWHDWMPDEKTYRDGVRKGREAAISSMGGCGY